MALAPIRLKDCVIRIQDATSMTGAVNNGAGYAQGASTMTVDGFVGEDVIVGSMFTLAGQTTVYTVTSRTLTGADTTSITFSPVLSAAVVDNDVITVGPNFVEAVIGDGNLTFKESQTVEYVLDRGVLDTTREGDEVPLEFTLDIRFSYIAAQSTDINPSFIEALHFEGLAAGWIATNNDTCSTPKSVDIRIFHDTPCTGVEDEIITLAKACWEEKDYNIGDGGISITGKCNVKRPTVVRQ